MDGWGLYIAFTTLTLSLSFTVTFVAHFCLVFRKPHLSIHRISFFISLATILIVSIIAFVTIGTGPLEPMDVHRIIFILSSYGILTYIGPVTTVLLEKKYCGNRNLLREIIFGLLFIIVIMVLFGIANSFLSSNPN